MSHIGHLGSSMLLLPASLVLLSILAGAGRRRDAFALGVALFLSITIIVGAKLAFYPCGRTFAAVESPSGHASLATAFYGIVALILAAGRGVGARVAIYAAAAVLAVLIGMSRVEVFAHTWAEVAVGIGLGLIPLGAFSLLRGPPRPVRIPMRQWLVAVPLVLLCSTAILLVARHWTPEPFIDAGARRLNALFQVCGQPETHMMHRRFGERRIALPRL